MKTTKVEPTRGPRRGGDAVCAPGATPAPHAVDVRRLRLGTAEFVVVSYETRAPSKILSLTTAERDILRLILSGASNAQIAARRRTSRNTVANQISSIYRKTGLSSRGELAAYVATLSPLEASGSSASPGQRSWSSR